MSFAVGVSGDTPKGSKHCWYGLVGVGTGSGSLSSFPLILFLVFGFVILDIPHILLNFTLQSQVMLTYTRRLVRQELKIIQSRYLLPVGELPIILLRFRLHKLN